MKMVYHIQNTRSNRDKLQAAKKTRIDLIKNSFTEFCKRTGLHGFKYMVMEELNGIERGCWMIAVIASVICAAIFVVQAYRWYARNPIVTVIESTQGAIWDIPFPAVTICDLNIISRQAALSLSKNLSLPKNVTDEFVFKTLRYLPLLHSTRISSPENKRDLRLLQDILDSNNIPVESLFKALSPNFSCSKLVERCIWRNTVYRCEQLFQQIYSTVSVCCSFNYFAVAPDRTRQSNLIPLPKPRRLASCGYQTALTVVVHSNLDDYYSTEVLSNGVMVFIDNAYNVPNLESTVRLISPSTEVLIALSPENTYTIPGIRSFNPEERKCYYHDEIKLGDLLQYSFHNCKVYEQVEIIKKFCNCIPFYFPQQKKVTSNNIVHEKIVKDIMQCLPECEHFYYPLEVALGNLVVDRPLNKLPIYRTKNLINRSILNVFYNDLVSTRYRRDVYLNWQNILTSFGGLLSLMLGFTLTSGVDFCLFFIIKMLYDLILWSRNNGIGSDNSDMSTRGTILRVQQVSKNVKKNKSFNDFNRRTLDMQNPKKY